MHVGHRIAFPVWISCYSRYTIIIQLHNNNNAFMWHYCKQSYIQCLLWIWVTFILIQTTLIFSAWNHFMNCLKKTKSSFSKHVVANLENLTLQGTQLIFWHTGHWKLWTLSSTSTQPGQFASLQWNEFAIVISAETTERLKWRSKTSFDANYNKKHYSFLE